MKPYNQKPLSLAARVMCFVGASVGLSLLLIGNLVLNVVERHFAEQDAEEVAVINKAVIDVLRNNNDNNLQLSKALFGAVSGHHGVYYQVRNQQGKVVFESAGANLSVVKDSLRQVTEISAGDLQVWHADDKTFRVSSRTIR